MATKKRKPAITGLSRPQGIIDDIIEVGADVVRRKTRDMAKHHIASGKRMRKAAKDLGKSEKTLRSAKNHPMPIKDAIKTNQKSIESFKEVRYWQDNRRKMRELIADAKGTKSVPTKASEARKVRERKQLNKKAGLGKGGTYAPSTTRRRYYGEYNK